MVDLLQKARELGPSLADRSEQPQRREVARGGVLVSPLHEGPDGGGGGVELGDPVPLDDIPEAVFGRMNTMPTMRPTEACTPCPPRSSASTSKRVVPVNP